MAKHIVETAEQFQDALKLVEPGDRILLKSGIYQHEEYGSPWEDRTRGNAFFASGLKGTAEAPIKIQPFGDGPVKVVADVNGLALKNSSHVYISDIEFAGHSQDLDLDYALTLWWQDSPLQITGRGIALNDCSDIKIQGCQIHHFPGGGITNKDGHSHLIKGNAIYHNCWYSISGSHGIANSQPKGPADTLYEISENLLFGNQCNVISRVWSKGFATMALDEGNGIHFQNDTGIYRGNLLVRDNLSVFNGKSGLGLNTVKGTETRINTVKNNTFAGNARTCDAGEYTEKDTTAQVIRNVLAGERVIKTMGDCGSTFQGNQEILEFTNLDDLIGPDGGIDPAIYFTLMDKFLVTIEPCPIVVDEFFIEQQAKIIADTQPEHMAHIEIKEH